MPENTEVTKLGLTGWMIEFVDGDLIRFRLIHKGKWTLTYKTLPARDATLYAVSIVLGHNPPHSLIEAASDGLRVLSSE